MEKSKKINRVVEGKLKKQKRVLKWSKEEDDKIFHLYKQYGSAWSKIALEFSEKSENQIKNRFYSTLRRVATKKMAKKNYSHKRSIELGIYSLVRYIDDAIEYGRDCYAKKGRKRRGKHSPTKEGSERSDQEYNLQPLPNLLDAMKNSETLTSEQNQVEMEHKELQLLSSDKAKAIELSPAPLSDEFAQVLEIIQSALYHPSIISTEINKNFQTCFSPQADHHHSCDQ